MKQRKAMEIKTSIIRVVRASCLALVMAPSTACSKTPYPIPPGTDTVYYGHIVSGRRFGVSIGDPRAKAREALESHPFVYLREDGCIYRVRILVDCIENYQADLYDIDQFLRRGLLILELKNDKVVAIVWDFQALPATDF